MVIDDRLPTADGKLIYLRSPFEDEFWPALLCESICEAQRRMGRFVNVLQH